MRRTFAVTTIAFRDFEFPDACPECGHDLTESLELVQLATEVQTYRSRGNDPWPSAPRSLDCETYEVGCRCPECHEELVDTLTVEPPKGP